MSKLDALVSSARDGRADWSTERADRVFTGALHRAARARTVRRSVAAASVVAAVAFVMLRGSAAPAAPSSTESPSELIAFDSTGDGGFARD